MKNLRFILFLVSAFLFFSVTESSHHLFAQNAAEAVAGTENPQDVLEKPASGTVPDADVPEETPSEAEDVPDAVPPKVEKLFTLPDIFPKTGRFALAEWGDLILTCPNTPAHPDSGQAHLPVFLRITPQEKIFLWGMCPVDPISGTATPLDAQFGSDEFFYVRDNPPPSAEGKRPGRIIRIFVNEARRPYGAEVVIYGMQNPVAMAIFGDHIYVLNHITAGQAGAGGETIGTLSRFPLDAAIIEVKNSLDESYIVTRFLHTAETSPIPDFLCFDANGTLFLGNSAAGTLEMVIFEKDEKAGRAVPVFPEPAFGTILAAAADASGNLYFLDGAKNRIVAVSKEKDITVLAENVLAVAGEMPENDTFSAAMAVRDGKLYLAVTQAGELPAVYGVELPKGGN